MEIELGFRNSLGVKLEQALTYLNSAQEHFINGDLEEGNHHLILAIYYLNDFINEIEAQRGKKIDCESADILITEAQEIIVMINNAICITL